MLTLSIADLRAAGACDLDERIADLRAVRPDVADDEPVPLAVWWALLTTSVPNRWWSLRAASPEPKARRLGVRGAVLAARRVLHLAYPEHRAVCEAAIAAAETWAEAPSEDRRAAAWGTVEAAARAVEAAAWGAAKTAKAVEAAWAVEAAARAAEVSVEAAEAAAWAAWAAEAAARAAWAVEAAARAAAWAVEASSWVAGGAGGAELDSQRADLDRLLRELE